MASASSPSAAAQPLAFPPDLASGSDAISITYQNGFDGYNDAFDLLLTRGGTVLGSDVGTGPFFLDGGPLSTSRRDYLIRFDDVIGFLPGQVPLGVTVLDASLTLRRNANGTSAANTNGAYAVYRLSQPFDATSGITTDFGGTVFGPESVDGEVDRIVGSFSPNGSEAAPVASATRAVQTWALGADNHGFAVTSDQTTDGWSIHPTGAEPAVRPQLGVTYTLSPAIVQGEIQPGVDGYNGFFDLAISTDSATDGVDQSLVTEVFIDGLGSGNSPETAYLFRFDGVVGSPFLPSTTRVYEADIQFVATPTNDAESGGRFEIRQMLVPFDATSNYASFAGDDVAMFAAGEVGPALDSFTGVRRGAVVSLSVTDAVNNWLSGEPNHGLYVNTAGHIDACGFFTSGATDENVRPVLRLVLEVCPADADTDRDLDSDDVVTAIAGIEAAQSVRFDYDDDGVATFFDTIDYLRRFDAGCSF